MMEICTPHFESFKMIRFSNQNVKFAFKILILAIWYNGYLSARHK